MHTPGMDDDSLSGRRHFNVRRKHSCLLDVFERWLLRTSSGQGGEKNKKRERSRSIRKMFGKRTGAFIRVEVEDRIFGGTATVDEKPFGRKYIGARGRFGCTVNSIPKERL